MGIKNLIDHNYERNILLSYFLSISAFFSFYFLLAHITLLNIRLQIQFAICTFRKLVVFYPVLQIIHFSMYHSAQTFHTRPYLLLNTVHFTPSIRSMYRITRLNRETVLRIGHVFRQLTNDDGLSALSMNNTYDVVTVTSAGFLRYNYYVRF